MERKLLYSAEPMREAVAAIASAIVESNRNALDELALVGLYKQGVPLAERIASAINAETGFAPYCGNLDITMYRDDFGKRSGLPLIRETMMPFDITGCRIVLVDDVLSTGRTIRAALDALTDYGRPKLIRLAVLVDRGDPEYPIRADYVGFEVNAPASRKIEVSFGEDGGESGVYEVEWSKNSR
ncbi:MAG: bifunctional pyr operon transcriptional regulator/uracil phosphoribosyltransferase PyrR [Victivallaceae bacterium]|nr:bifunctional pyr operon transcriptional regulator/uracil phosphoribosyltransferase PyrR [Victivallaceae bacterium]